MKVDTHIHSNHSRECELEACSPELIMKAARKADIDALCIADHDTLDGYREAVRIRRTGDPIVIPACEVSTSRGHLLVVGVERCWAKGADPLEVHDVVESEGGLVSAPHPFYLSRISVSWLAEELGLAVEVFNAMASILVYPNLVADKFAKKYDLPVTGGSDAHRFDMVGLGITETPSDSVDGFISDVKKRRARAYGRRPGMWYSTKFALKSALGIISQIWETPEA
jgi:predicted metal-dependent phosphoesterase TrpH